MIQLDGIDYIIKTPDENLDDVISVINTYCEDNDIRNSYGEVIHIEANEANPLYQILRGLSYLTTDLQKLVYSAGCANSIAESSDKQLLNLSEVADVPRRQPTKTTINGSVVADNEEPCDITTEDTCTVYVGGEPVVFHPAYDLHLEPGQAGGVVLIAETYGTYNISANTVQFDEPISGMASFSTLASAPGQPIETIASLRNRIQNRATNTSGTDRAEEAIIGLNGVAMCSIVFNYNAGSSLPVMYGDTVIQLPPRQALLLVQGYNTEIARTFYRHLTCLTYNPEVEGVTEQTYITHANQSIPVYVVPPLQVPLYIRIYVKQAITTAEATTIKNNIGLLGGEVSIGQSVTSVMILEKIGTDNNILGVMVALAEDGPYSYIQTPKKTELLTFNINNMDVVIGGD